MRLAALNKIQGAMVQPGAASDGRPNDGAAALTLPAPTLLKGEVLPPIKDDEVTRTALKRAMRKRAQELAVKAIDRLEKNLSSEDPEIAGKAANDILKWGFGNPATEIEAGGEGLVITLARFADQGSSQ